MGPNPWGEQATLTSGTRNSMIPMKKAFFLYIQNDSNTPEIIDLRSEMFYHLGILKKTKRVALEKNRNPTQLASRLGILIQKSADVAGEWFTPLGLK
jgi:hypothetical protein